MSFLAGLGAATPIILQGSKIAKEAVKASSDIQKNAFRYDFTGLITGLVFILVFAKLIEAYIQLVSGVQNAALQFIKLLGFQVPTYAPPAIVQLVNEGYSGIKYWDMIKFLCVAIIGLEWLRYKDQLSYAGHGVFALLGGFFVLITVPDLFRKLKENRLITP